VFLQVDAVLAEDDKLLISVVLGVKSHVWGVDVECTERNICRTWTLDRWKK